MEKLQNSLKVVVPVKNNDGQAFDYQTLIDNVTKVIGGSTVTDGKGYWFADDGTKYIDTVKVAEFDSSNGVSDIQAIFDNIIKPLMLVHQQLAVTVQVNNSTFIIDQHDLVNSVQTIDTLSRELMVTPSVTHNETVA